MRGLPASWYLDPARGPLEFSTIFLPGWQLACHAADLPAPGTAARFDCGDHSAFVLRTRDGDLRAFRNACRHRGSRLIDGDLHTGFAFCVDGRVRCPYHGWTYDDRGVLESVPPGQRFDAAELAGIALETLPVAQWRGFVFISLGRPAQSLESTFAGAAADWPDATRLRRLGEPRQWSVRADWKLACEHLLDASHVDVSRTRPAPRAFAPPRFATADAGMAVLVADSVVTSSAALPWPARAYLALSAQASPDSARAAWLFVWPNLLLCSTPDALTALQVLPTHTGACTLRRVGYGVPGATRELRALRYLHERVQRRVAQQDQVLLERLQHGLASVAPDEAAPIDGAETGQQWFAARCRRAWATAPSGAAQTARRRRARRPTTGTRA